MAWSGVYINLDRSTERRAQIEQELARVGLAERYRRFSAINGADLGEPPASAGIRGCYESHLAILRSNAGLGWLHIVEDDAVFSRFAGAGISAVADSGGWDHFDVVFTNVRPLAPAPVMAFLCGLFDKTTLCDLDGNVTDVRSVSSVGLGTWNFALTTGYLVNSSSAGKIADRLVAEMERQPAPVDALYSRLAGSGGLAVACTMPFLTIQRLGATSTIQADEDPFDIPLKLQDAPFFADRDVREIKAIIADLRGRSVPTATTDLVGAAHQAALAATRLLWS